MKYSHPLYSICSRSPCHVSATYIRGGRGTRCVYSVMANACRHTYCTAVVCTHPRLPMIYYRGRKPTHARHCRCTQTAVSAHGSRVPLRRDRRGLQRRTEGRGRRLEAARDSAARARETVRRVQERERERRVQEREDVLSWWGVSRRNGTHGSARGRSACAAQRPRSRAG